MTRLATLGRTPGMPLAIILGAWLGSPAGQAEPPATAPAGPPRAAVQGYRIEDWKALSNDSLLIRTNDGRRYRATLMGPCIGLRHTDAIAFVTRGERTVDRFAGIMLPDGSRCYFKTFESVSQPPDAARDGAGR